MKFQRYRRRRILWKYKIVLWILAACSLHQLWYGGPSLQNYNINTSFEDQRAIFVISMGQEASETKVVERFVWSARMRGLWKGWIILLTDSPKERYASIDDVNPDKWVVWNPKAADWRKKLAQDMPYKRFKTYVLDYVSQEERMRQVEVVYYLDVDIVVAGPLVPMMKDLEAKYKIDGRSSITEKGALSQIWFFKGNYAKTSIQGGQMIAHRRQSQGCLQHWRQMIDSQPDEPKDQPHLHRMYLEQQERQNQQQQQDTNFPPLPCYISAMDQESHLQFPSNGTLHGWYQEQRKPFYFQRKRKYRDTATLVHIKNSGKVMNVSSDLEAIYLQSLLGREDLGQKMHFRPG